MIILDTTTRSLEIDLNGAVTTNQLPFVASYVDIAKTTTEVVSSASNTGQTNSTTAVTLVAAPGTNQTRHLKYLSVRNADTVATLLWIQVNDNSTLREIWKGTLAVGDTLVYTDSLGWNVLNTSGQIKTGSGISSIGASTDNALVRWDGTGGTAIQNSGWTLADTEVLTAGGNIALGANYISRAGTAAGLSLDAGNNVTLSGNLTVSGAGPHAIGGATDGNRQLRLLGTFTAGAGSAIALSVESTLAVAANQDGITQYIAGTLNKAGSGVHSDFVGLRLDAPTIGAGAAALTNASTLKITGAPTGATNNYALWVAGGTVRIDSGTITTGSTTALSLATSNGTQVVVGGSSAGAVNYARIAGGPTTVPPIILAEGTDSNIQLRLASKGTSSIGFWTNGVYSSGILSGGALQLDITHTASATNYLTLTGSNGGDPNLTASGGNISLGASAAVATTATAGLIRIPTCAGTPTGAVADGNMVIDTTNHKLYFRSGATWRDAGP